MFIDIKENDRRVVPVLLELFNKYPQLYDKAIVTSFFPLPLYLIRKYNPNIVCSMAYRPRFFAYESLRDYSFINRRSRTWYGHTFNCLLDSLHGWMLPRLTYYILGLSLILLQKNHVSCDIVDSWREKGIRVFVWTVNSPIEKQYFLRSLNVTYLTDTLIGENRTNSAVKANGM